MKLPIRLGDAEPEREPRRAHQPRLLGQVRGENAEAGEQDQDREWDLEVGVDEHQPLQGVDVEVRQQARARQQQGDDAVDAGEGGEGQGQRHADEVAGHVEQRQEAALDGGGSAVQREA